MNIWILAGIVIVMQLGDAALTYLSIRAGTAREANPIMIALQKVVPGKWTWLFGTKAVMIVVVVWLATAYPQDAAPAFYGLMVLYAWVLINNYHVWQRGRNKA